MARIIADRFMQSAGRWMDLATGAAVRVHRAPAGSPKAQVMWADRCAVHAGLRHPAINALLDYGVCDRDLTFEAYEAPPPLALAGGATDALLPHAIRFLEHHGVLLPRPLADFAVRVAVAGPATGRAIGVVLQSRAAIEAIVDALDASAPAGACAITIRGASGSGLRTARVLAARAARLRGYVPIDASLLGDPRLGTLVADRHVCVFSDDDGDGAGMARVAPALAQLGPGGGRRHVVLSFTRHAATGRSDVQLEPLGVVALVATIHRDADDGPRPDEILSAARAAEGLPGRMLALLGADRIDRPVTLAAVVREVAPAYAAPAADAHPPAGRRRTGAMLLRATRRAELMSENGRHAAAERVLRRAFRLLAGRGERAHAAHCGLLLARLYLDRGRTERAAGVLEDLRAAAAGSDAAIDASVLLGRAWMDDGRLVEAEAVLRTAHLAAAALPDVPAHERAAAALTDCLRQQARADEAAALPLVRAVLQRGEGNMPLAAAAARLACAMGRLPDAVRLARAAVERATLGRDLRHLADAHGALAAALACAGDHVGALEQAGQGLEAARRAHLPMAAIELQLLHLASPRLPAPGRARLLKKLHGLARLTMPRRLAAAIEAACAPGPPSVAAREPVADLEAILEICRAAPGERAAIEQVCADVATRLRALTVLVLAGSAESPVLGLAGRAWRGEPLVARRVLASTLPAAPEPAREPCEAGEPIRYGGETIAALACRWAPGTLIDPVHCATVLRMAALAVSASVRSVLDTASSTAAALNAAEIVGTTAPVQALRDAIVRAARAPFPVLVEGESGSGKELVARAIHRLGPRRERRFCPVNCAALTEDLLEAELFGHARGAFTGAVGERAGLFEEADGGTLFLDEIGELSARGQAKLLRVLQDGEVRRVGENIPRRVDVRVVAATNRRLAQEADAGRFRADLRFRLDVVRIEVPPLRERPGDIPMLAAHFWSEAAARVGSRATLSPDALAALARYDWPGNVRELQNVVAWIAVQSPARGRIGAAGLPAHVARAAAPSSGTFEAARIEFERRFVRAALATASGQRAPAAAALGVSRQGLAKMIRRLGLDRSTGS